MQFNIKRRMLLGAGLAGLISLRLKASERHIKSTAASTLSTDSRRLLRSVLNTIIPKDDYASAVEAGVDRVIEQKMQTNTTTAASVDRALVEIERVALARHKVRFSHLDIDQREQLLSDLIFNSTRSVLRRDLASLRAMSLRAYYQSNQGQKSLRYILPARYPAFSKNQNAELTRNG